MHLAADGAELVRCWLEKMSILMVVGWDMCTGPRGIGLRSISVYIQCKSS
jgi:hypothetical protein